MAIPLIYREDEDCFEAGRSAAWNGCHRDNCRYPEGSRQQAEWLEGYDYAIQTEQELAKAAGIRPLLPKPGQMPKK